jgi:hypothetical protein
VRVVGFPESPNFKLEPHELSRFASCSLDERPKRQSSLAQQLALEAFEQEQKPKLRAINTKSKTLNIRTTRRASTPPAGLGASTTDHSHSHNNITVQNGPDSANDNRISFEFPSTLPSGAAQYTHLNLHRAGSSAGSEAMAIPQGLTKAYTAPQPLPELSELSPSLVAIIEGSNNSGIVVGNPTKTTTPNRRSGGGKNTTTNSAAARLLPSPASNHHSPPGPSSSSSSVAAAAAAAAAVPYTFSPHIAAERGAQAQVAGLREALRQQQEEVARLQLELAKLAMQQQSSRQRSSSSDVHMTPATPDAPDEHHQGSGGGGGGRGDHHRHHHGRNSMSLDECMESPFEGVATTQPYTTAQQQWNGEHYS